MFENLKASIKAVARLSLFIGGITLFGEMQRAIGKQEGIIEGKLIAANEIKDVLIKHGYDFGEEINDEIAGVA